MNLKKQSFWQIVFEFLSIVFAVLLALGLNSYKQTVDLKKESELLSKKLVSECKRNLIQLDSVIQINEEHMAYMDSLRQAKEVTSFGISFSNELLSKSAWSFTQASRSFSYMDEEMLYDASKLYEEQEFYMHISNQMFQNLGDMLMKTSADGDSKTMLLVSNYYLSNLLEASKELRANYREFIQRYDQPD